MSLWFVWHSRRAARRAGPQRRRLRTAPGWAAIVLAASVAAACYVVLYRMTDTDPWLTRGLAIVWGAAAVYSIALVIRKHLDLRDHGIVVQGGPFRLWTYVRRAEWDREKSGRLAFGRGWRRIVAVVPPEQRDAVEALLAEKLGEQTAPSEED